MNRPGAAFNPGADLELDRAVAERVLGLTITPDLVYPDGSRCLYVADLGEDVAGLSIHMSKAWSVVSEMEDKGWYPTIAKDFSGNWAVGFYRPQPASTRLDEGMATGANPATAICTAALAAVDGVLDGGRGVAVQP